MKRSTRPLRWDQKHGLKGTTVYLHPADKRKFKQLAKDADQSLSLYHRRLIERHIKEKFVQD